MMRLPHFTFHAPLTVHEAADRLAESGAGAMLVAGGTDLLPNMKRRQQVPATLIGLRGLRDELAAIHNGNGMAIGAGVTLAALAASRDIHDAYRGLWQAASQ